jgi:hypothetical protein
MKQNRFKKSFGNFLRVNEDVAMDKLRDGELASLRNAVLDNPFGQITMRGGYEEKNTNQPTGAIQKIVDVRSPNPDGSGNVNYLLAGNNGDRISRSVGGAWTDVRTGLNSGSFRHAPFNDSLVFTNGVDDPFILSGDDLSDDSILEIEEASVLDIEGQLSTTDAGFLPNGTIWHYILVYVTDDGQQSNPSIPFTFVRSNPAGLPTLIIPMTAEIGKTKVLFSALPVSSDTRVTKKKLYRTEGFINSFDTPTTDATIFYLIEKLDNDVTQYADGIADEDLDFSDTITYLRVPESAKYLAESNDRLFLANVNVRQKNYFSGWSTVRDHDAGNQTVDGVTYANSTIEGNLDILDTSDNATGLTDGYFYQYMYTYMDINGLESDPSYGIVIEVPTGATGKQKVITYYYGYAGVGANDMVNNPQLISMKVYRTIGFASTFAQNANTFYLIEEVNRQHTTRPVAGEVSYVYTDSTNDTTTTPYATTDKEHQSAIAWSQVDRPALFYLENIRQIFRDSGDVITGIFDDGNGVLIFKEKSIIKLYHTGAPQNWYIRKIYTEHGCDEPLSIVKVGNTYYFRFRKRVYSYVSGGVPKYISFGKQKTLSLHTVLDAGATDKWLIYTTSYAGGQYQLIFDRQLNTWYEFTMGAVNATATLIKKYTDFWTAGNFYPVAKVGKTYEYNSQATHDWFTGSGVDVLAQIGLPAMSLGQFAKLRTILMDFQRADADDVVVNLTTHDTIHSPITLGATQQDLVKVLGYGGKRKSNYFGFYIYGRIKSLSYFEAQFRPVTAGLQ